MLQEHLKWLSGFQGHFNGVLVRSQELFEVVSRRFRGVLLHFRGVLVYLRSLLRAIMDISKVLRGFHGRYRECHGVSSEQPLNTP